MTPEIASLADGLSEAQRLMLDRIGEREDGHPNSSLNFGTLRALRRRGLSYGKGCNVHGFREHITPLGEQVRAHLIAQEGSK